MTEENTSLSPSTGRRNCLACRKLQHEKSQHRDYVRENRKRKKNAARKAQTQIEAEYPWSGGDEDELTLIVAEAFHTLPDYIRGDVCQLAIIDILAKDVSVVQLQNTSVRRRYIQQAHRDYQPHGWERSLEQQTNGQKSLRERI